MPKTDTTTTVSRVDTTAVKMGRREEIEADTAVVKSNLEKIKVVK